MRRSMDVHQPVLRGELARHPSASRFAAVVRRIHGRYADEVVARHRLCPFLRDAETGFGVFCVILDRAPDLERALAAVSETDAGVIHLVFPCIRTPAQRFERFSSAFGKELGRLRRPAPVLASFHPEMAGDASSYHRLVGLLRHAPDPFVQLIPEGLSQGGTVLADSGVAPVADPAEENFARLQGGGVETVQAKIAEILADRDVSYAPFLEEMGLARPGPRFDEA